MGTKSPSTSRSRSSAVHNHSGDVVVRAVDRSDVFVVSDALDLLGTGDEVNLAIDVHQNRIQIHSGPGVGAGWPGMGGDLDAFVGQITKAFRRGSSSSPGKPGRGLAGIGRNAGADIAIEIPRAMTGRIEVHNSSGDVQVEGANGEIALTTASGDLRVLRTSGELTLQTASGDVVSEGGTGRLTAHTASGDIRIVRTQCDSFHVQTANGDITLDAMLAGDGAFQAKTVSGDVRLTLRQPTIGEETAATLAFAPSPVTPTSRHRFARSTTAPGTPVKRAMDRLSTS